MKGFYKIPVKNIEKETPDAVSVEFDIEDNLVDKFKFTQGQHLTLRIERDNQDIRRTYSLCTSPLENRWKVGIKKVPGGIFSTYANEELKIGDVIEVMPPQGKFYTTVNPDNSKTYVAFAVGSGITPILSIMKTILTTETSSTFTLFYGNKNRHSVMFKEDIEDLKNIFIDRLSVYHIFTREDSETQLFNGRLEKEKIEDLLKYFTPIHRINEVFLCGPRDMIFNAEDVLIEQGISKDHIHYELFYSGEDTVKKKQKSEVTSDKISDVSIILDGRKINFKLGFDDQNILDKALSEGADLPFACKGGVCATCKAKLTEGSVEMDLNYALEEDELANNYILTCQSHPTSEKVVVNFDK